MKKYMVRDRWNGYACDKDARSDDKLFKNVR